MSNPGFRKVLQFLWDSEPANTDLDNPIVCLGVTYDPASKEVQEPLPLSSKQEPTSSEGANGSDKDQSPPLAMDGKESNESGASKVIQWSPKFLEDVKSRMWFSYRTGFPLIPRSKEGPSSITFSGLLRGSGMDINGFTSDVGWGCMIRTGQSLLANALMLLKLGREWRVDANHDTLSTEQDIAKLFCDDSDAPFSVHNFVSHGERVCGKKPGEWFGPSAAASSIRALVEAAAPLEVTSQLRVYVSNGSDIYEDQLLQVALEGGRFKPTLILVCLRLGIDHVNPIYWNTLRSFLEFPQSVGIAGGRPSASHYFFGFQGDYLFYLDPHQGKPSLKEDSESGELSQEALSSLHTKRIRKLHLQEMDPSMLVGFLIRDEADYESWKQNLAVKNNKYVINFAASEPKIIRRASITMGDYDNEFIEISKEDGEEETREEDGEAKKEEDQEEGEWQREEGNGQAQRQGEEEEEEEKGEEEQDENEEKGQDKREVEKELPQEEVEAGKKPSESGNSTVDTFTSIRESTPTPVGYLPPTSASTDSGDMIGSYVDVHHKGSLYSRPETQPRSATGTSGSYDSVTRSLDDLELDPPVMVDRTQHSRTNSCEGEPVVIGSYFERTEGDWEEAINSSVEPESDTESHEESREESHEDDGDTSYELGLGAGSMEL